jgi:hypothetical protein
MLRSKRDKFNVISFEIRKNLIGVIEVLGRSELIVSCLIFLVFQLVKNLCIEETESTRIIFLNPWQGDLVV